MTLFETFLYFIGLITSLVICYVFFIKHIFYGLKIGLIESKRMFFIEYSGGIKNDWSEWDKLWLVPRTFRLWFFRGFWASMNGYEIVDLHQ